MNDHGSRNHQQKQDAAALAAAEHLLTDICRYSRDQAFDALMDIAQRHHLGVIQLARGLLELVSEVPGSTKNVRGAALVAFEHWGHRLTVTGSATPTAIPKTADTGGALRAAS
jgi:hypothetical protein